ncbi:MAG: hypothetical protein Q7J85_03505 [Bacillota bacterium]|nr:hypothetical protein [Bacillota bacterium]
MTTSRATLGLGVLVTGLGKMIGGKIGNTVTGFGLAHIVLGSLDMFRPTVRGR